MSAPVDPLYIKRATETGAVTQLRRRIEKARLRCISRAERTSSWDAGMFMLRAAQIASGWAFAAATESQLEDVITLLTALSVAANASERLEAHDARLER